MKGMIIKRLFIPFMVYFFTFIISITFVYQDTFNYSGYENMNGHSLLNFIIIGSVLLPLQAYFWIIEIRQLINQKLSYFREVWNFLDILSLLANTVISAIMMATTATDLRQRRIVNVIGAGTVILMYLKVFYFLRIFEATAPYIKMIVKMTVDIQVFIYVYFFAIVGFGNGFYLLSLNNEEDKRFVPDFISGILYVYRMTLGDFDTSEEGFGSEYRWAVWVVFLGTTLFVVIIMLNLLIAIMGDAFGEVQQSQEQSRIKEYLQLILDNEFLIDRATVFKDVKYIVSISLDKDRRAG